MPGILHSKLLPCIMPQPLNYEISLTLLKIASSSSLLKTLLYYASPVTMLSIITRVISVHIDHPVPCRIAIRF
jgi:hypothetical protein